MLMTFVDKARSSFRASNPGKFVALDFDGRVLRACQVEPAKDLPKIRHLADVDAPEGLDAANAEAVGQFIGDALKQLGLTGMRVVMDVPRSRAVLKPLTLPPVDNDRELPAMVRYQVERELPFPLEDAVVDFTIAAHAGGATSGSGAKAAKEKEEKNGKEKGGKETGEKGGKPTIETDPSKPLAPPVGDSIDKLPGVDVLVAAVRKTVVEYYEKVAAAAGIKLQSLGLRPYADVRCFEACLPFEQRRNAVLVHVLSDEAEINVVINGALTFSRAAPIKQHDDKGQPLASEQINAALTMEVARSVQSALTAHRGAVVDIICLTGDTGREAAVAEALHSRLRVECRVLDPVQPLRIKRAKTEGRGSITPIGLAIAHAGGAQLPFDFLNPKKPPVERDMAKIRRVALAASIGLLVVGGLAWGVTHRVGYESRATELENELIRLEDEIKPVDKLAKRVSEVIDWKQGGDGWLDHWANISAHLPPATDAYITSLKSRTDGGLVFDVKAKSSAVITSLTERLDNGGYVVSTLSESKATDDYGYDYRTTVQLRPKKEFKVVLTGLEAPKRPSDDGSAELIGRGRSSSSRSRAPQPPARDNDNNDRDRNDDRSNNERSGSERSGSERSSTERSNDDDDRGRSDDDRNRSNDDRRSRTRR